ncbi:glycosyltransferase family 4 protein [Paenibacillus woosongensis]|uniref:Glycosyltransferase n=1 Tax=Paenibacillus woosongensis TaxID=307580 RepID=A0A7X3CPA4_9BACL|nr:glycosyltransferase family 4 protein [Paenibacillus woosongensis]MUG47155.1 glycosyltransferase [Paenibacillus woosongensis]
MIQTLRQNELLARNNRLSLARPQHVCLEDSAKRLLKVTYVMTHVSICGGVKVIFEHANRLKERGWDVVIVSHFPKPDWYPIQVEYRQIPFGIELAQGVPICDVIVATYWDHIQACIETGIAPVVYFEQGDEHLFHIERLSAEMQLFVKKQMQLPAFIMTVSHQASSALEENFGRNSVVIPNAIDHGTFKQKDNTRDKTEDPYILMMGNENITFKGIPRIISAFKRVKSAYPNLRLYWINPKQPDNTWLNAVDQVYVNPPQTQIAELFQNAFMFVSASEFESFSLPVLEAMATGCPVVSTKNDGVMEYGIDRENIVFAEIGSEEDLVKKIFLLLENPELRQIITKNGLSVSQRYNWDASITNLMDYLTHVSEHKLVPIQEAEDWIINMDERNFIHSNDLIKFKNALLYAPDDYIYIPVIYDWVEQHPIARWELAASRKTPTNMRSLRIYTPSIGSNKTESMILGEGIQHVIEKKYEEALNCFIQEYATLPEEWKSACSKWIILCLIELGRDNDAIKVIKDALNAYEGFTDAYYLYFLLLNLHNMENEASNIHDVINMLGDSMGENEWFYDLETKLRKYTC